MVFENGSITISKTVLIPASIIVGTGAVYALYQLYSSSQACRALNFQVSVLAQRLLQLEAEVSQLRLDIEQSGSSDDEFVDASDAVESSNLIRNRKVELSTQLSDLALNSGGDWSKGLKDLFPLLDFKIEQGGLKNLTMVYNHLSQLSHLYSDECSVFWRLAQAAFLLVSEEVMENPDTPKERQKDLMLKAKEAADKALKCNTKCPEAHKWMAIVLGSITKDLPSKIQIENAYVIKNHIDAAIQQKPDDSIMYHIKGRWCYSVYMLSWIERKIAATLFATPPTATLQEAKDCFEKAEELKPLSSMDNLLYLGKVNIQEKEFAKATKYLAAGEKLTCSRPEDFQTLIEIRQLLKQYGKYYRAL